MSLVVTNEVAFGRVFPDGNQDIVLRLGNNGEAVLNIVSVDVAGTPFSILSAPAISAIPAGSSTTMALRFAPTGDFEIEHVGTLTIRSNDPDTPRVIDLNGLCVDPFRYRSAEGPFEVNGITEMGDISDPPRKYLRLESNFAGRVQRDTTLTPLNLSASLVNRIVYGTNGVKTKAMTGADGNNVFGTLDGYGYANLQTASLITLSAPANTFESYQFPAGWAAYAPGWVRSKTSKYFANANLPATPSEATRLLARLMQGFNRTGGLQGTSRSAIIYGLTWTGTAWQFKLYLEGDTQGLGTPDQLFLYAKTANGNQDPGTVTTSDVFMGNTTGSGGSPAALLLTITLPPNTSLRFLINRAGNLSQFPQQISEEYNNGSLSASGLTSSLFDRWLYLPAAEADLPAWRYEERLGFEDTIKAAIARQDPGDVSYDYLRTAETTSLSGGVTAESVTPLTGVGRVTTARREFPGLTIGHNYRLTIAFADQLISGGAWSAVAATQDFLATSVAQTEPIELVAPVGKRRKLVNVAVTDLGAAAVNPSSLQTETVFAYGRVLAAGSSWTAAQQTIADNLIVSLKALSSFGKIKYLLPFIGPDLTAALIPLIDPTRAGSPTNHGFLNADFSQATGLQGNGSSKYITLPFKASQLGSSNNGGVGYWELSPPVLGSVAIVVGTRNDANSQLYGLQMRSFDLARLAWGDGTSFTSSVAVLSAGYFHGERRGDTDRELYKNGSSIATNTAAGALVSGSADRQFTLMAAFSNVSSEYWGGRCGLCVLTNGTLSDAEVAALHTAFAAFIAATGR